MERDKDDVAINPIDRSLLEDTSFSNVTIKLPRGLKDLVDKIGSLRVHFTISDYIREAILVSVKKDMAALAVRIDDDDKIEALEAIPTDKARLIVDILNASKAVPRWEAVSDEIRKKNKKRRRKK